MGDWRTLTAFLHFPLTKIQGEIMGIKTIAGVWMCTLAMTAMAAFSSPKADDVEVQAKLSKTEYTICSALETQNFCE